MMLAFLLSKTKLLRKLITKQNIMKLDVLVLIGIFGMLGALGSYFSIPFNGALVNTRIIGVAAGGILGGPIVGFGAGLIAGIHRYFLDVNGLTTFACSFSTIIEGLMSGIVYYYVQDKEKKWMYGLGYGAAAEIFRKLMLLVFVRPIGEAVIIIENIAVPMIIVNSIGLAIFLAMIENAFIEQEKASAHQAKLTLRIASKTLPIFRKGFNYETAKKAAQIIYDEINIAAVSITDKEKILAHIGVGSDHHVAGGSIMTELTKRVIKNDQYEIVNHKQFIDCNQPNCLLSSAVIVPLKEQEKVLGTLKLYKTENMAITNVDVELALGIAQLFSTQLEVSKIEHQAKLLSKAELRSLQAQINPHFLFNVLNTIAVLCRVNPDKAREVTVNLAQYYRKNLKRSDEFIELEKEMEHVKSYLAIEKVRFDKKLNIEFEMGKVNCLVPPLIIQPIVENAVKHGILPKENGGSVNIKVYETEKTIEVVISDDGVGIPADELSKLFAGSAKKKEIGLYNVNQRLVHLYGEKYGLKLTSTYGKGTTVNLTFPKDVNEIRGELYGQSFIS